MYLFHNPYQVTNSGDVLSFVGEHEWVMPPLPWGYAQSIDLILNWKKSASLAMSGSCLFVHVATWLLIAAEHRQGLACYLCGEFCLGTFSFFSDLYIKYRYHFSTIGYSEEQGRACCEMIRLGHCCQDCPQPVFSWFVPNQFFLERLWSSKGHLPFSDCQKCLSRSYYQCPPKTSWEQPRSPAPPACFSCCLCWCTGTTERHPVLIS